MSNEQITARLVYDGGDDVWIPPEMGTPRDDQMQGTAAERLSEIAGRVCYDSLGKGRASFSRCSQCDGSGFHSKHPHAVACDTYCEGEFEQGYHDHIREVGHGSVLEHFNFTVEIPLKYTKPIERLQNRRRLFSACCLNRPGVIVLHGKQSVRITLNLRSAVQWLKWEQEMYDRVTPMARQFSFMLRRVGNLIAPHIVPMQEMTDEPYVVEELLHAKLVDAKAPQEQWISLFLCGSRGFSHEMVRHGDFTAISQRSTRYVDESEGDWIEHPLVSEWRRQQNAVADEHCDDISSRINDSIETTDLYCVQTITNAKKAYNRLVFVLEDWLVGRKVDKGTARKQARGAARGFLGNALATELVFSASVAQWRWMIHQRASVFADAEIREVFAKAIPELKRSRYGEQFADVELAPSPDGIGQVAVWKDKG